MIRITRSIAIDDKEIKMDFIHASGPGGQNVNKVATAVQLRFDIKNSPSLSNDICERLIRLAGRRVSREGVLVIQARRFRSQERNRQDAIDRLVKLIKEAVKRPSPRRSTKPTRASKERRLNTKRQRADIKQLRQRISPQE